MNTKVVSPVRVPVNIRPPLLRVHVPSVLTVMVTGAVKVPMSPEHVSPVGMKVAVKLPVGSTGVGGGVVVGEVGDNGSSSSSSSSDSSPLQVRIEATTGSSAAVLRSPSASRRSMTRSSPSPKSTETVFHTSDAIFIPFRTSHDDSLRSIT